MKNRRFKGVSEEFHNIVDKFVVKVIKNNKEKQKQNKTKKRCRSAIFLASTGECPGIILRALERPVSR